MSAKPSPGPWTTDSVPYGELIHILDSTGRLAGAAVALSESELGSGRANARLMAAAPELLEALLVFVPEHHTSLYNARSANGQSLPCFCGERVKRARLAIAKAKGEP